MYGFYYHFSSLGFRQSQHVNDCSAAHVADYFASSEQLTCRLLIFSLDHPMNVAGACARGFRDRAPRVSPSRGAHIMHFGQFSYFQFAQFQIEGLKSQNHCSSPLQDLFLRVAGCYWMASLRIPGRPCVFAASDAKIQALFLKG